MAKILLIRFGRVGDVVLALNAARTIKLHEPEHELTFLTDSHVVSLLNSDPDISEVVGWNRSKWKQDSKIKILKELLYEIIELRKKYFDIIIDFQGFKETAILSFIIGAKRRIGFKSEGKGIWYTHAIPPVVGVRHDIEPFLKLITSAGFSVQPDLDWFRLYVGRDDKEFANEFIKANKLENKTLVAINPGASASYKRWAANSFASVAKVLFEKHNVISLILWGPGEEDIAAEISSKIGVKVPHTNLGELAGLLQKCKLLITNDSGPMHIASALGVKIVAIFFKEHSNESLSKPFGAKNKVLTISVNNNNQDNSEKEVVRLAEELLK